jgi:hypothetical protein
MIYSLLAQYYQLGMITRLSIISIGMTIRMRNVLGMHFGLIVEGSHKGLESKTKFGKRLAMGRYLMSLFSIVEVKEGEMSTFLEHKWIG